MNNNYPCDCGDCCPFGAHSGYDCHNFCGLGADETEYYEEEYEDEY